MLPLQAALRLVGRIAHPLRCTRHERCAGLCPLREKACAEWHLCLQGLQTGNYSFQAYAVDAAGNVGNATSPYQFVVDSSLAMDGQPKRAQFWGLGWKFWLIIGSGGFLCLLLMSIMVACCCRWKWLRQQRRARMQPVGAIASQVIF